MKNFILITLLFSFFFAGRVQAQTNVLANPSKEVKNVSSLTFYWKENGAWTALPGGIGTITLRDNAKFTKVGHFHGEYADTPSMLGSISFSNELSEGEGSTRCISSSSPFFVVQQSGGVTQVWAPTAFVVNCAGFQLTR